MSYSTLTSATGLTASGARRKRTTPIGVGAAVCPGNPSQAVTGWPLPDAARKAYLAKAFQVISPERYQPGVGAPHDGAGIGDAMQEYLRKAFTILSPERYQPGVGAPHDGAGIGDILSDIVNAVNPIVGPAIAAGEDAFSRRITGAILNSPGVQSTARGVVANQAVSAWTQYAPYIALALAAYVVLPKLVGRR